MTTDVGFFALADSEPQEPLNQNAGRQDSLAHDEADWYAIWNESVGLPAAGTSGLSAFYHDLSPNPGLSFDGDNLNETNE